MTKKFPESVALISDPIYQEHLVLPYHPEQPKRLEAIINHIRETNLWERLEHPLLPKSDSSDEHIHRAIMAVHPEEHINHIRQKVNEAAKYGGPIAPFSDGGDTNVSSSSFNVAIHAVAGILLATDLILAGKVHRAFTAVRPPGHHCDRMRPMGFCLFNNIAIAARYAQWKYGVDRVFIIDWDVHHGNGTQSIFYEDPSVCYVSLHQYPHYPGTGRADERGTGKGEGTTLNFPLPAGTNEKTYEEIFREKIIPAIKEFKPGLILISAGFDAHRDDPLGDMLLTENSFALFTRIVCDASVICEGRIVSTLEGGYNLYALSQSAAAHVSALGGIIDISSEKKTEESI